jgi:hypothetical protein
LRMSGICTTRGMATILPDLTAAAHGHGYNCIQFTPETRHGPAQTLTTKLHTLFLTKGS